MADFGHDAESREGGGTWGVAAVGYDEEGKWRYLLLTPGHALSWTAFAIYENKRGQFYWEWEHYELGHTTKMESRRSFQTRALCLRSLCDALHTTRSFGGLIEDMERWG